MQIPSNEIDLSYSRSGGAGGQNVNKVSTRVTLKWNPRTSRALSDIEKERLLAHKSFAARLTKKGEVVLHEDGERSQEQNRINVLLRLSDIVTRALSVPRPRHRTRPTRRSREKRLSTKKARALIKSSRGRIRDT